MRVFGVLNGPNLNRLGVRETSIYGSETLADLESALAAEADSLQVNLECFQSNNEGAIIDKIAEWTDRTFSGIILNAGAFTHTSVAIRDAISASDVPVVEVHLSNIYQREEFRHHSLLAPVCRGVIAGLGFAGYHAALRYLS